MGEPHRSKFLNLRRERRASERASEQASKREIFKKLKIVEHIELEMKGADVKAGSGASILR